MLPISAAHGVSERAAGVVDGFPVRRRHAARVASETDHVVRQTARNVVILLLLVRAANRLRPERIEVCRSFYRRLAGVRLVVAAVAGGTAMFLVLAANGVGKRAAAVLAASQLAARVSIVGL